MMHEREKSDPARAGKPTNKAEATSVADAAEPVEQRAGAKGNASEQSTHRTQGRERVSHTALLHHIDVDILREAFFALKRDAAPGADGLMWRTYEANLDLKLTDLLSRVDGAAYRALPSRRTYIPKADGHQVEACPAAVNRTEQAGSAAAAENIGRGGEKGARLLPCPRIRPWPRVGSGRAMPVMPRTST